MSEDKPQEKCENTQTKSKGSTSAKGANPSQPTVATTNRAKKTVSVGARGNTKQAVKTKVKQKAKAKHKRIENLPNRKAGVDPKARHERNKAQKQDIAEIIAGNCPRGKTTKYTEEMGAEICIRLAHGESLNMICESPHIASRATVLRWIQFCYDDLYFNEEMREKLQRFSHHYDRARILQAETFIDDMPDIVDDSRNDYVEIVNEKMGTSFQKPDHEVVNRSKLRVETRKWLAEVHLPKIRALKDRNIEIGGKAEKPVNIIIDNQDADA